MGLLGLPGGEEVPPCLLAYPDRGFDRPQPGQVRGDRRQSEQPRRLHHRRRCGLHPLSRQGRGGRHLHHAGRLHGRAPLWSGLHRPGSGLGRQVHPRAEAPRRRHPRREGRGELPAHALREGRRRRDPGLRGPLLSAATPTPLQAGPRDEPRRGGDLDPAAHRRRPSWHRSRLRHHGDIRHRGLPHLELPLQSTAAASS
jgi:hypothetical protein